MSADPDAVDVIDAAAGLVPGTPLFAARRFRATAIAGTQASHDALLHEPVAGLGTADRLRVAVHCCEATGAVELAAHYRAQLRLGTEPRGAALQAMPPATRDAMLQWAGVLTTDPRQGDRTALQALVQALAASGLGEVATNAAVVALAQLVAFLSYQTRVVAGLKAMVLPGGSRREQRVAPSGRAAAGAPAAPPVIRINGFTNDTLQWRSWLTPVDVAQASPLQLQVLDESHAQARTSEYYLTLIHQPLMLRHRSAAYNAIMYAQGGLPRAERELGAMVVSVTNGCVYCTSVHAQRYAQLARRHDTVAQVFTDPSTAGSSERERAIARFAQAMTLRPQALGASDIEPLRALGMSDEEVIDLLHAVAIFGWANRLMHNLGEPVGPDAA